MLEQQIQTKILKYLKEIGAYSVKTIQTSKSGTPDILCCLNGKFIAIEVKRKGGIVSALQSYTIEQIQKAGGIAFVAYSVEEVKEMLGVSNSTI